MKAYLLALGSALLVLPAGCGSTGASGTASPPPGPPSYQQGYVDGCTSGENAANNIATQVKNDASYRSDADYRRGWNEAHDSCLTGAMNRKTRY